MKIFAADYDGTFMRGSPKPGEMAENIRQADLWRKAGNLFLFATGRDVKGLLDYLPKGLVYDYIVGLNGGTVATYEGEIILEEVIPRHVADEIIAMISKNNIQEHFISDETENGTGKITILMDTPDEAIYMADLFSNRLKSGANVFVNDRCVDIVAPEVSKATGIACVARRHNIACSDIYCIGDSHNDVPMLNAYNGFTMPDVDAVVDAAAIKVYNSVGEALWELNNKRHI